MMIEPDRRFFIVDDQCPEEGILGWEKYMTIHYSHAAFVPK
jgi:hypothetical protein